MYIHFHLSLNTEGCRYLTARVAVEGNQVDSVGSRVTNAVASSILDNLAAQLRACADSVTGSNVGSETGNVGRSHGSTSEGSLSRKVR